MNSRANNSIIALFLDNLAKVLLEEDYQSVHCL